MDRSDDEIVKLVEENIHNYELKNKGRLFFCTGNDNMYYIATYVEEDEKYHIRYFQFDFEELVGFVDGINKVIARKNN